MAAKIIKSPITTIVLFVLAAALLLGTTIGGARAALTYYSENYTSRVQMYDIGVTLVENGENISWRDYGSRADGTWSESTGTLLSNMIPEGSTLKPGVAYPEALAVTNSGTIDEYVRVSLYRYWVDADGKKMPELSPELIDLHLVNLGSDWLIDEAASTPERTVLYYNRILASGATTPALSDTITIDGALARKVTQTTESQNGYTVITTTYDYNGVTFQLEAEVDAVQTHNAENAIWSAWGRRVTATDGVLSLS